MHQTPLIVLKRAYLKARSAGAGKLVRRGGLPPPTQTASQTSASPSAEGQFGHRLDLRALAAVLARASPGATKGPPYKGGAEGGGKGGGKGPALEVGLLAGSDGPQIRRDRAAASNYIGALVWNLDM